MGRSWFQKVRGPILEPPWQGLWYAWVYFGHPDPLAIYLQAPTFPPVPQNRSNFLPGSGSKLMFRGSKAHLLEKLAYVSVAVRGQCLPSCVVQLLLGWLLLLLRTTLLMTIATSIAIMAVITCNRHEPCF